MRAFVIKKGTKVLSIKEGQEWYGNNFREGRAKKDLMFYREDIGVDPVGKIGCHRGDVNTVGGMVAEKGLYAFRCPSVYETETETPPTHHVLVHMSDVQVY